MSRGRNRGGLSGSGRKFPGALMRRRRYGARLLRQYRVLVLRLRPRQRLLMGIRFLRSHGGDVVFCYERALAVSSCIWFLIPMTESRGAPSTLLILVTRRACARHCLDVLRGQQGGQR